LAAPGRVAALPLVLRRIIVALLAGAAPAGSARPRAPQAHRHRSRHPPPICSPDGSWQRPLGSDRLGRDLLSRLFYGARVSLAAGVVTVALAGAVGGGVGLVAGYLRGRTGALLMRVTDATLAFPIILLALVLAVTLGPSFSN